MFGPVVGYNSSTSLASAPETQFDSGVETGLF